MKRLMFFIGAVVRIAITLARQKSTKSSPPATATGKVPGGANVKIDYSQPSEVKEESALSICC